MGGTDIGAVKPRLRQDAVFLEIRDAAYVRHAAGPAFVMKGRAAYRWLASLAPYLDGRHTFAELIDGLEPEHARTAEGIVRMLLERGLVRDAAMSDDHDLPAPVVARFASQLSFLEHLTDSPGQSFAGFRDSRVLLVGGGEVARSAGESLLRNGLRRMAAAVDSVSGASLLATADALGDGALAATVDVLDGPPTDIAVFDLVVYCGRGGRLGGAAALAEQCRQGGIDFLPCLVTGEVALLGPLVEAGQGPQWSCALARLADNDVPASRGVCQELALGAAVGAAAAEVPTAVQRMLGNAIAFEVFRHRCAGVGSELVSAVVAQDVTTLETEREHLLAYPTSAARSADPDKAFLRASQGLAELLAGERDRSLDDEGQHDRLSPLFGRHVGVFQQFTDDPLPQIPLKAASIQAPVLSRLGIGQAQVHGFAIDTVMQARVEALHQAVGGYALVALAATEGFAAPEASLREAGVDPVAVSALSLWTGTQSGEGRQWVPGRSLVTEATCAVPAAAACARPGGAGPHLFEPTAAGVGSGPTAAAALAAALDSALAHDRLRELAWGAARVVGHELSVFADTDSGLAADTVARRGADVEILEVLGSGSLHVVIVRARHADGSVVSQVGTGLDLRVAALRALVDVGGRLQCLDEGFAAAAGAGPLSPGIPIVADLAVADPSQARLDEPVERAALLRELAERGRDAVVVGLTPPDVGALDAVDVVRVLLTGPADRGGAG